MGLRCLRVDGAAKQGLLSFSLYFTEVPGNLVWICYRPLARDETRPRQVRCFAGGGEGGEVEAGWRNVCVM